tara:strand:+ start:760 stop:1011 length:252 start_codon:yes stop_codon:yes gene_type:complete
MAVMIFVSAMSVVFVRSANRQNFLTLKVATLERDRLTEEWGRLQLERATWSLHELIEEEARTTLKMNAPKPSDIIVIRLDSQS